MGKVIMGADAGSRSTSGSSSSGGGFWIPRKWKTKRGEYQYGEREVIRRREQEGERERQKVRIE
jgi:hypothetical protein